MFLSEEYLAHGQLISLVLPTQFSRKKSLDLNAAWLVIFLRRSAANRIRVN